jgi:hypothetical protein
MRVGTPIPTCKEVTMLSSRTFALLVVLALPVAGWAMGQGKGRPGGDTCPPDVEAALATGCPCEGRSGPAGVEAWKSHGKYVSCVARERNRLRKAGCSQDLLRSAVRCAAKSSCGKEGAVVCCFAGDATCSDPAPGDTVVAGTCSNDATRPCNTVAECLRKRLTRDEATCLAEGGVSAGAGSLCTTECPAPAL